MAGREKIDLEDDNRIISFAEIGEVIKSWIAKVLEKPKSKEKIQFFKNVCFDDVFNPVTIAKEFKEAGENDPVTQLSDVTNPKWFNY